MVVVVGGGGGGVGKFPEKNSSYTKMETGAFFLPVSLFDLTQNLAQAIVH